jgi:3-dehydroquinate dehydratase-2
MAPFPSDALATVPNFAVYDDSPAYPHTSVALADAIGGIRTPVVEVHISNVHAREAFRQNSFLSAKCVGSIVGLGLKGYELAVEYFVSG